MTEAFDVAVVGAGPAGLAAAVTAAERGMLRVCLIDDNPGPGGQIWRGSVGKETTNPAAARWLQRLHESRVEVRSGWRAVAAQASPCLRVERDGDCVDLALLRADSGHRREGSCSCHFPVGPCPESTARAGLQAFVKSGLDISGKRVVIAGTVAVAAGCSRQHAPGPGAHIVTVVEQAPMSRLIRFSLGLAFGHAGKLIDGAGYAARTFRFPSAPDRGSPARRAAIISGQVKNCFSLTDYQKSKQTFLPSDTTSFPTPRCRSCLGAIWSRVSCAWIRCSRPR